MPTPPRLAEREEAALLCEKRRLDNVWRLMHSFRAGPASSQYTTRINPALARFADEVRGTLARLSAYAMALALLAILGTALWGALTNATLPEPATAGGWSQVERPARAFAVGQANLHDKTEVYEIFRHPEGGRKDTLRWIAADGRAVAELEIYRPGGEFHEKGLVPAGPFAGMDRGGTPEREAAGLIASKFGPVTLRGPSGSADDGRACLGFIKWINDLPLQISGWSCQGDDVPARRAAVGCLLNRLVLLAAGNDARLAELFARAELRRSDCAASAAFALTADWVTVADNPKLRGGL